MALEANGELGRVLWHCRRGLLELDLILEKFTARHLTALDADGLARFKELLAMPDNDLFDLIMGRGAEVDPCYGSLIKLLRTP